MQEKNNHTNEHDTFSQWARQQLENHQLPVDESLWQAIEQRLVPAPKRRIPVWYWLAGGVAAVVAMMLLIRPYYTTQADKELAQTTLSREPVTKSAAVSSENPARLSCVPAEDDIMHPAAQADASGSAGLLNSQKVQQTNQSTPVKTDQAVSNQKKTFIASASTFSTKSTSASTAINTINDNKRTETAEKQIAAVADETAKKSDINPAKTEKQQISSLPDLSDYPEAPADEPAGNKKKQHLLLAANVGAGSGLSSTGGGLFFESGAMSDAALVNSTSVKAEYAADIKEADYFNEVQHLPPVSFGLMAELPLSKSWSVESGLVYTYLESRFTRTANPTGTGHLKLHYLGLPLYLKAKLWHDPTWSIYLNAGPMIEKGLQSVYSQDIDYTWSITHTDVHSRIEGLQWSLNTGLGVNYKIQKALSVFFEPKLTYYLDNNQPMSARTEQPLVFGVNGGVRIEL